MFYLPRAWAIERRLAFENRSRLILVATRHMVALDGLGRGFSHAAVAALTGGNHSLVLLPAERPQYRIALFVWHVT